MKELAELLKGRASLRMRQGVVTAVAGSSCSVLIGGSSVPVDGVQHLNSVSPAVGDIVWIASDGADLWILGTHGAMPLVDTARLADGAVTEAKIADLAVSTGKIVDAALTEVKIASAAVTEAKIAASAVTAGKLAAAAVDLASAVVTGQLVAAKLADNAVTQTKLASAVVDATKLADAAVTEAKIAAGAVTAAGIGTGAVLARHLVVANFDNLIPNPNSELDPTGRDVTPSSPDYEFRGVSAAAAYVGAYGRLCPGAANYSSISLTPELPAKEGEGYYFEAMQKLSAAATTDYARFFLRVKKADGSFAYYTSASNLTTTWTKLVVSVPAAGLPAGTVSISVYVDTHALGVGIDCYIDSMFLRRKNEGSLIVDGAITATQIAAATITGDRIAAGTIAAGNIAAHTITAAQIAAGAITATEIAADTITAGQIAAGAIGTGELAAGAVIAGKVAAGVITATEIAAATITGDKIAANTIAAGNIVAGTITATEINAASVQAAVVTAAAINALTINAVDITGGSITGVTITGGTLQTATSGARVVITSSDADYVKFYSGHASEVLPGAAVSGASSAQGYLLLSAPMFGNGLSLPRLSLVSNSDDSRGHIYTSPDADLWVGGRVWPHTDWSSGTSADGIWIQEGSADAGYDATRRWKIYYDTVNHHLFVRYGAGDYAYFTPDGRGGLG